ncbi:MAG: hypothetical protein ACOYB3_01960 [Azonexus sp.]
MTDVRILRTRIAATGASIALLVSIAVMAATFLAGSPTREVLTEEDAGWNCLTMGNHLCGPDYLPMSSAMADALAEGEHPEVDWMSCLTDKISVVVCPDGTVVTL